jgi:hypothetical protein
MLNIKVFLTGISFLKLGLGIFNIENDLKKFGSGFIKNRIYK